MKNKLLFIFFILLFAFSSTPTQTLAHELIPKELKEYIVAHPSATPEEIKKFTDTQNPEFSQKFKNGEEILKIARNQNTTVLDNIWDFFKIGVNHILTGPDHILFVLSLLLFFVSWRQILKFTGVFTIAHSITLILAGSGILVLSSRIVEPLIALSIAYVAISSVFLREKKIFGINLGSNQGKTASIFFFGLFHGLGFAGLLQEIQVPADKFVSSLFAFNLGIEGGQLIIIALAFPFIYFCKDKIWYPKAMKIFAIIISTVALFWFIQRLFFV